VTVTTEARQRTLFDQAPIGILYADADGTAVDANPRFCRLLGYTREALIGLPATTLVAADAPATRGLEGHHRDWHFRRHDGTTFTADVVTTTCEDGTRLVMVREASEARLAAERAARDEQQLADAMIESMPGVVYFYDATRRFRRWNHNLEAVTGYTAEEIVAMDPLDLLAIEDRARVGQRIAEVFETGEATVEATVVARDGRRTPYHFTGRRVHFEGQACLIGVGIDITAQQAAEAARAEQARAEAADRVKSAFLATMSHELRTPLNSIIGFTGVLLLELAGPLNAEQHTQLGMVRTSARHLLALVNDVLDISKIEAGQLEIGHAPFPVARSIAKVVDLVSPTAQKQGVTLRATVAPEVGTLVADERRVEQILLNLIGNAVKFTDRGEVVVAADVVADPPSADWPAGRPCLRLRVVDTGIGIRAEDLPSLFQPFRQIDAGLSRRYEGTGLGLAICARLAHLMGGRVEAHSQWGEGSTFTVTLPLEAARR
jgi:PAS domain S-box-containing protein